MLFLALTAYKQTAYSRENMSAIHITQRDVRYASGGCSAESQRLAQNGATRGKHVMVASFLSRPTPIVHLIASNPLPREGWLQRLPESEKHYTFDDKSSDQSLFADAV